MIGGLEEDSSFFETMHLHGKFIKHSGHNEISYVESVYLKTATEMSNVSNKRIHS